MPRGGVGSPRHSGARHAVAEPIEVEARRFVGVSLHDVTRSAAFDYLVPASTPRGQCGPLEEPMLSARSTHTLRLLRPSNWIARTLSDIIAQTSTEYN